MEVTGERAKDKRVMAELDAALIYSPAPNVLPVLPKNGMNVVRVRPGSYDATEVN